MKILEDLEAFIHSLASPTHDEYGVRTLQALLEWKVALEEAIASGVSDENNKSKLAEDDLSELRRRHGELIQYITGMHIEDFTLRLNGFKKYRYFTHIANAGRNEKKLHFISSVRDDIVTTQALLTRYKFDNSHLKHLLRQFLLLCDYELFIHYFNQCLATTGARTKSKNKRGVHHAKNIGGDLLLRFVMLIGVVA